MISLDDARKIQYDEEKKAITRLIISMISCVVLFAILFAFTDLFTASKIFLILPVFAMLLVIYYSGVLNFFLPRKFTGRIVKIKFFSIRDNSVNGAGWYMPSMLESQKAVKVTLVDRNGKKLRRTFCKGDVVSQLEKDIEITVFRFVDIPMFVK